jgi:hypothetical protein
VLAAVNDALRRLRRWPGAIIDRGCARCHVALRSGQRNGFSQTKKLTLDFLAAIRELLITYDESAWNHPAAPSLSRWTSQLRKIFGQWKPRLLFIAEDGTCGLKARCIVQRACHDVDTTSRLDFEQKG